MYPPHQVLGKKEIKSVLKWREKVRKEEGKDAPPEEPTEDPEMEKEESEEVSLNLYWINHQPRSPICPPSPLCNLDIYSI